MHQRGKLTGSNCATGKQFRRSTHAADIFGIRRTNPLRRFMFRIEIRGGATAARDMLNQMDANIATPARKKQRRPQFVNDAKMFGETRGTPGATSDKRDLCIFRGAERGYPKSNPPISRVP